MRKRALTEKSTIKMEPPNIQEIAMPCWYCAFEFPRYRKRPSRGKNFAWWHRLPWPWMRARCKEES